MTTRSELERNNKMERKQFSEYKKITKDRTVVGFPSTMGNVDGTGDLIVPGAFRKTIQERSRKFRWLWSHDFDSPPIAKILEIREVGIDEIPEEMREEFPEITGALRVEREYLETFRGEEVWQGIVNGVLDEMSIGFDTISADFPEDYSVNNQQVQRIIKEIRLWEMSDVLWGMNPATRNQKSIAGLLGSYLEGETTFKEEEVLLNLIAETDPNRVKSIIALMQQASGVDLRSLLNGQNVPEADSEPTGEPEMQSNMFSRKVEIERLANLQRDLEMLSI